MALFGTNLKKLLEKKGLTEMMLAQKLGITQQAVNEWISKGTTPRAKRLDQIAEILGVTVNELFYAESEIQSTSDKVEEMVPKSEAEEWKEKYFKTLEKLIEKEQAENKRLNEQVGMLKNIQVVPPHE